MINIVLIEDEEKDIRFIQDVLLPLKKTIDYELIPFQDIKTGLVYIQQHSVQLILLDLEFTLTNESAIFYIDQINPLIPIIVVSHLSHYQRQLQLKANVVGFVSKGYLADQLVRSIIEILSSKKIVHRPTSFVFPGRKGLAGRAFDLSEILFIKVYVYEEYIIHKPDTKEIMVASLPFSELCKKIESDGIVELQPISRNRIINTNYISEVLIDRSGRVMISLLGYPESMKIGPTYQNKFKSWYTN